MKLSELCQGLKNAKIYNFQDKYIRNISYDSRKTRPGDLFVAISGTKTDGYHYLQDALSRGAVAVVTERPAGLPEGIPQIVVPSARIALALLARTFYGDPSKRLTIIGVTGTNGKTTTTFLLRSILQASGKKTGLLGTIYYYLGDRLLPSTQTTPQSLELQAFFHEMLSKGITHVVMEVSSHSLTQYRTHGIEFQEAIFTNLTMEHLDYHSSFEDYREAKSKLFRELSPEAFAVLNLEDRSSEYMASQTRASVLWYGGSSPSELKAQVLREDLYGTEIRLSRGREEVVIVSSLIGSHNLHNILAASTGAVALGLGLREVKRGVESLTLIPGRLERLPSLDGLQVFVDYAHTPHALESVLGSLRPLVRDRLLLVFGCGGDRDKGKRPVMGHIAEKYSDLFWITSDNPRTERPTDIIRDIESGTTDSGHRVQADRHQAIEEALSEARDGDVILIAGKGHERTQIFAERVVPFDDREVAVGLLPRESIEGEAISRGDCVGISTAQSA